MSKTWGPIYLAVIFASLLIASPVAAAIGPHTIDFESDTVGYKPNGWQSLDSTVTFFTDSDAANLYVDDFGDQSDGQALSVEGDDPSYLIMDFSVPMEYISLDFGNDDPDYSEPGDEAILTLYYGATQVGQVSEVMNRNDLMDQTINFSGAVFDKATFYYDSTIEDGLIEIVDNIHLEPLPPSPPHAVGGEAYPVNKLAVLAPWIGVAVLLIGGITWLTLRRRKAYS